MTATTIRALLRVLPIGLVCSLAVPAAAIEAQTLGDIARAEAARRAAVKGKGQTITDKDIKPAAPPAVQPKPAAQSDTQTSDGTAATPATGEAGDTPPEPMKPREKRDEAYWRKRFTETREAAARAGQDAADVQARIQALDLEMQDTKLTPARRNELRVEKESALTALKRFKQDAADLAGELAGLEQRARDAKIDPAWTR
jgi:hypothetical protein